MLKLNKPPKLALQQVFMLEGWRNRKVKCIYKLTSPTNYFCYKAITCGFPSKSVTHPLPFHTVRQMELFCSVSCAAKFKGSDLTVFQLGKLTINTTHCYYFLHFFTMNAELTSINGLNISNIKSEANNLQYFTKTFRLTGRPQGTFLMHSSPQEAFNSV